jgi:hypothetical protein
MTPSRNVAARRRTQVLGSLGVVAAAAAVAGLGTFGTFSDSTTPIATDVATGTVSIDVTQPGRAIPVTTVGFLPGDSMSRAVDLVNDGSSPLARVDLASAAAATGVLTSDASHGLQLTVRSCSGTWDSFGSKAPTFTCAGSTATLYSGPAVMDAPLGDVASLQPGGVDHLVLTLSLPTSAGESFQDQSATLGLTFTGTQRAGVAR